MQIMKIIVEFERKTIYISSIFVTTYITYGTLV